MTNPTRRALRSSAEDVRRPAEQGLTRRQLREQQRAAESIALTASEARAAERVMVVEGSAPLYTTRRAMREAATRIAHELPVQIAEPTFTEPLITVDAPSLGNGGDQVPGVRQPRALAPRVVRQTVSIAPPPRRTSSLRGIAQKITAGGALLFIGSLVVVTSLPAQAVQSPTGLDPEVAEIHEGEQTLAGVATEGTTFFARDDVVVNDQIAAARMSEGELAAYQAVADGESPGPSYGGDPAFPQVWGMLNTGFVQTPFPGMDQVPMSSGFGYRPGGFHGGADFTPGLGTDIRPIANGVVSAVWQGNNPGGGGYAVFIDHNIDGQFVQSWYAHMLPGSIQVEVGQVVDITTVIGQVGNSGRSTGPHLHLELKNSDYVSYDPVLWLQTREMNLEYRAY
ncbi:M23 family metallopeptidase [Agrococcus sp. BE272]|uniref:M23 family metallopeptidase n=1 Tax=Agrococcus sp. BE272 TaxID=2817727 RepID=UPI0028626745|nr:M23 family metallopeptidase [Agrococcus sp. BE272]MDR7235240.1 murein DD-endopeptidase MepM/ murein hydrolase activator NlpD [Agrococcus sp. BE272]